jgi:hypothetical protein
MKTTVNKIYVMGFMFKHDKIKEVFEAEEIQIEVED